MTVPVCYFSDGRICPVLLTESELITFLRLDTVDVKCPSETVKRYRDAGLLRATQISRRLFYRLESVLEFIEAQEGAVKR